ncbi:MAG TPA: hypothetical protein VLF69_02410 [Candidatus Saccharimonadales bacterium]|nr:hypothetical protein [Candidatus Saccharimonadales bacterium]
MFHYWGVVLVLLSWLAGAYLVSRWRNADLPTLSKHGASSPNAHLFFAGSLTTLGSLFYWWLIGWFAPHLQLGISFVALITVAIGCQILAGIVPDTAGLSRRVHRIAAYAMAVTYLPLSVIIICSGLPFITRLFCILLTLYMAITFTFLVLLRWAQKKFL